MYVVTFQNLSNNTLQEFGRTLKLLWQQMLANGFWSTWSQLVDSLDPFGEKNALRELGLAKGASQEEIRARYTLAFQAALFGSILRRPNQDNVFRIVMSSLMTLLLLPGIAS